MNTQYETSDNSGDGKTCPVCSMDLNVHGDTCVIGGQREPATTLPALPTVPLAEHERVKAELASANDDRETWRAAVVVSNDNWERLKSDFDRLKALAEGMRDALCRQCPITDAHGAVKDAALIAYDAYSNPSTNAP